MTSIVQDHPLPWQDAVKSDRLHSLDASVIRECFATFSILLLAAGTSGNIDQVNEALGGIVRNCGGDNGSLRPGSSFLRPCHNVVWDFQLISNAWSCFSHLKGEDFINVMVLRPPNFAHCCLVQFLLHRLL